jgi:hypothetical protein
LEEYSPRIVLAATQLDSGVADAPSVLVHLIVHLVRYCHKVGIAGIEIRRGIKVAGSRVIGAPPLAVLFGGGGGIIVYLSVSTASAAVGSGSQAVGGGGGA